MSRKKYSLATSKSSPDTRSTVSTHADSTTKRFSRVLRLTSAMSSAARLSSHPPLLPKRTPLIFCLDLILYIICILCYVVVAIPLVVHEISCFWGLRALDRLPRPLLLTPSPSYSRDHLYGGSGTNFPHLRFTTGFGSTKFCLNRTSVDNSVILCTTYPALKGLPHFRICV